LFILVFDHDVLRIDFFSQVPGYGPEPGGGSSVPRNWVVGFFPSADSTNKKISVSSFNKGI
jgi:hypothetical protein